MYDPDPHDLVAIRNATPLEDKRPLHVQIAEQTSLFLARGGRIQKFAPGEVTEREFGYNGLPEKPKRTYTPIAVIPRQPPVKPSDRRCSRCAETKPLDRDHFKLDHRKPHGFASLCRACDRQDRADRKQQARQQVYGRAAA